MHDKNIKIMVKKQLKEKFPHWNRLNRNRHNLGSKRPPNHLIVKER